MAHCHSYSHYIDQYKENVQVRSQEAVKYMSAFMGGTAHFHGGKHVLMEIVKIEASNSMYHTIHDKKLSVLVTPFVHFLFQMSLNKV